MKRTLQLFICFLISNPFQCFAQSDVFSWPDGAKAAVCLTYDDGIDSQLDIAIPDLDRENLRGTFYIEGDNLIPDRINKWKEIARTGHELGNHTIFHPCSRKFDFVPEEFESESYTVRRMLLELSVLNNFLYTIDGEMLRSYAYPCGETMVGGTSIIDSLRAAGLFVGARGGSPKIVKDIHDLDIFNVPSFIALDDNASNMIPLVEEAKKAGGLVVFMFHGIGGDYLSVSRNDHYQLLRFLNENRKDYWTATFKEIIEHIIHEKNRLGWE